MSVSVTPKSRLETISFPGPVVETPPRAVNLSCCQGSLIFRESRRTELLLRAPPLPRLAPRVRPPLSNALSLLRLALLGLLALRVRLALLPPRDWPGCLDLLALRSPPVLWMLALLARLELRVRLTLLRFMCREMRLFISLTTDLLLLLPRLMAPPAPPLAPPRLGGPPLALLRLLLL